MVGTNNCESLKLVMKMEGFKNISEMCEASALLDANHISHVYLSPKMVKVDKRDLEEVKALLKPYGVPVVEYTPWDGELSQEEIGRLSVNKKGGKMKPRKVSEEELEECTVKVTGNILFDNHGSIGAIINGEKQECPHCGGEAPVGEDIKYCPWCGKKLTPSLWDRVKSFLGALLR